MCCYAHIPRIARESARPVDTWRLSACLLGHAVAEPCQRNTVSETASASQPPLRRFRRVRRLLLLALVNSMFRSCLFGQAASYHVCMQQIKSLNPTREMRQKRILLQRNLAEARPFLLFFRGLRLDRRSDGGGGGASKVSAGGCSRAAAISFPLAVPGIFYISHGSQNRS